ncbi:hypothetical protein HETIRDRAFT_410739 [Heterobasidion irregulare TC 32-1]|uniref:Tetratricopeptide SHNi-TPR domain-containing protein n=1 Tax=Heterobasidion irregulare (strain TC 32-1) TaxID=747525 RepID=W4JZ05_HETIT|nr:uncharacterized protein HETIRDRAFT_410739 [Heterobasidion irregulare TC 32-1]ETW78788.1 hypothetical protein HETIRDRAFT_410739 [Heterobasidion irregulare TC 32-1]
MSDQAQKDALTIADAQMTIESALDHAKRAFALKKYEHAVDHYATALELMTTKHGEDAPEMADVYFAYGKALLENAIAQSSVLGKEQTEEGPDGTEAEDAAAKKGAILSFSGDAEDVEDAAVDLFAEASRAVAEEEREEEEEEGAEGAEPEDDFNAAWEVLDLARTIYDRQKDEDEEVRLKLADTYITLGDVSLETEKFEQAITDYTAALSLKTDLLPLSSRQIAEAHYKLSMVLDLTSGRLADAIMHAQRALESVDARLSELKEGLTGTLKPAEVPTPAEDVKVDTKGKGKATGAKLVRDDLVQNMSRAQIEAEVKDLSELREDLALKVDELKSSPNDSHASAPELAARALDEELRAGLTGASLAGTKPLPVNDLTTMVKKKKKAPDANGAEKRKADDESSNSPAEKKARLEDVAAPPS